MNSLCTRRFFRCNRIKNTTLERKTTKEKKRFSIIKVDIVLLLTTNFFLLAASVIIYNNIYVYQNSVPSSGCGNFLFSDLAMAWNIAPNTSLIEFCGVHPLVTPIFPKSTFPVRPSTHDGKLIFVMNVTVGGCIGYPSPASMRKE